MKRLLIGAVTALSLCLGIGAQQAHAAGPIQQKGVSIGSRSSTDFASTSFRQSVDNAVNVGVNYITLIIPVHQDNIYSSSVYTSGDAPTDDALRSGLSYLKSKGISSAVAIHDNPYDGQWRALINAGDKAAWFDSYSRLLNHYADVSQSVGVSQIIIGTELSTMTRSENTSQWLSLIASVRQHFSGSLTYSAQHAGFMSDAQTLGFWPQLDKIGISAYYGLGNDSSVEALKQAWDQWNQQEISVLAARYNKPVIFTEVGYVSRDGGTVDPGNGYTLGTATNAGLQANAYEALFSYWNNYSTVQGVFFWDWNSDPNAGGSNNNDYTPQNKPAQDVLKKYFTAADASTTPPPAPAPASNYTISSTAPGSALTGSNVTVPLSVSSSNTVNDALVDIEVYDSSNLKVAQSYAEHQTLSTGAKSYQITWKPATPGNYTIKAGIFTANWQKNLYWNNSLRTVSANNPAPAPVTPPPAPVKPPVPPAPTPAPEPTPPKTLPSAITIWWPGGTVSGVQPYKALIENRDTSSYDIYWQVDGGTLNKLGNDVSPIPHKQSNVDMSNWRWNANNQYVINFVAKDSSGKTLSQKSITITVNH